MKNILLLLICLMLVSTFAFADERHCWRQDISRSAIPTVTFSDSILENGATIVPNTATLSVVGFGSYEYACENGSSGASKNYFEIYDTINQRVIRTNGVDGVGGPENVGSTTMCFKTDNSGACYLENGIYYDPKYTCKKGPFVVGDGVQDSMIVSMREFKGEQKWIVRMGVISPSGAGIGPGSEKILFATTNTLEFYVDSSKPAILVFPPNPLQKINSFDTTGDINKTVYYSLLNKSRVKSIIRDYNVSCPMGVTCELEKTVAGVKYYNDFTLLPNQAMMIPVKYSFNKDSIPRTFDSLLSISYTPSAFNDCENHICTSSSSAVRFESGLLDKQDFQINILNQKEQKYCVDYEGHLGKTGSDYAPRINLYFGGNTPPSSSGETLVSLAECSPMDYNLISNTLDANPDWVYCTQNEFLTQLSARIGLYAKNLKDIDDYFSNGDFDTATKLRQQNGPLATFTAYLREQDLNEESRVASVNELLTHFDGVVFKNVGYARGEVTNAEQFKTLIKNLSLSESIGGVSTNNVKLSPGEYKVIIDLNKMEGQDLGGLFISNSNELNPYMGVKVYLEKVSEPKLDWFFYYINDNYSGEIYSPIEGADAFSTNYLDRGTIMNFEKRGDSVNLTKFYSTFAVPIIARIVDKGEGNDSDSSFKVDGDAFVNNEVFSVWTGFASSVQSGCGTTSARVAPNKNAPLPYRILDSNLGRNTYEISDLNNVKSGTSLYVETVLYLPASIMDLPMHVKFRAFTLKGLVDGNANAEKPLTVYSTDYTDYTIDSLKEVFQGVKDQSVCVYYDDSTSVSTWKLFWNQDKILDALKVTVNPQITDATICESRELMSS